MKKVVSILSALLLCFVLLLSVEVKAAIASGSLTGPSTVRAGDTITLSFNINGSNIYGVSGTLSYDSNQVTLSGTSQKVAAPWVVEFNGNNFVAYDNNLSSPINSNKTVFTVTFQVKSVAPGTSINISYTTVKASDGSADANIGTVTYSTTVAAPLSTDNNLGSLTVSNATIFPSFSEGTTNYTASVPFSISKLDVKATAKDGKANISVNSPNLVAGGTTNVTVTVTAENGAKKTYTIKVSREKDPNYVASGDSRLSDITVDGFLLSPVFKADITKYVIWLPYETTNVKISGTAADHKASVETVGGEKLLAGQDNEIKVICTAENGAKKEYVVIAKRAAAHDGSVEEKPTEESIQPSVEESSSEVEKDTEESMRQDVITSDDKAGNSGISVWIVVLAVIISLGAGALGGYFGKRFIDDKKDA